MYYVYNLIDPRDDSIFYVGKGKGNRIAAHEDEAVRGSRSRKCHRIREIWHAGFSVIRKRVQIFETEDEAYSCEADQITTIGLANLTNVVPGGRGHQSYAKFKTIRREIRRLRRRSTRRK